MSARRLAPWETRVSAMASLPADRDAWLSLVLPVLLAAESLPRAEAQLASLGHALPRDTLQRWTRYLSAEHAAGRLPEAPDGLPERRPSGRAWRASQGLPPLSRGVRAPSTAKRPRKAAKRKRASATAKRAAAKKTSR